MYWWRMVDISTPFLLALAGLATLPRRLHKHPNLAAPYGQAPIEEDSNMSNTPVAFVFRPATYTMAVRKEDEKQWHQLARILRRLAADDTHDWVSRNDGICGAVLDRLKKQPGEVREHINALRGTLFDFLFERPAYPVMPAGWFEASTAHNNQVFWDSSDMWAGEYGDNRRKVAAVAATVAEGVYAFLRRVNAGTYTVYMPDRDPSKDKHKLYLCPMESQDD